MHQIKSSFLALGFASLATVSAGAQCVMPATSQFEKVDVVTGMANPSHFALLPDGRIFVIEQWSGKVHFYQPGQGRKEIGTVPTNAGRRVEDGMLGIVADLNFDKTNWIYILHTPAELGTNRLTRYTVKDGALTSPKKILEYKRENKPTEDQRHAGGGMSWNRVTGDLFIATGDDTFPYGDRSVYGPRDPSNRAVDALRSAANTNDLRGKVLRIRPIAFNDALTPEWGPDKTYSIPANNLFPLDKYPLSAGKTRPEIYTMGHRNAYRVKVDPVTGWAILGEVGPDAGEDNATKGIRGHDEINLLKSAGNYGWPFENAGVPYKVRDFEYPYLESGYKIGDPFKLNALQNLSALNTGLIDLPPARAPIVYYSDDGKQTGLSSILGGGGECVMAGPVYDYNPENPSTGKLPPYFHRKYIFGDHVRRYIWLMTLDAEGALTKLEKIADVTSYLVDLDIASDGTLYVLDYGGKIFSLKYRGEQYAPTACGHIKPGCMNKSFAEYNAQANLNVATMCVTATGLASQSGIKRTLISSKLVPDLKAFFANMQAPEKARQMEISDLTGKTLYRASITKSMVAPEIAQSGIMLVRFLED